MNYRFTILLICLLFIIVKMNAQTASSRPVSEFYSALVKEKIKQARHPVSANAQRSLPGTKPVPQKVKDLGKNARRPQGNVDKKKLPGNARIDTKETINRNRKFIPQK